MYLIPKATKKSKKVYKNISAIDIIVVGIAIILCSVFVGMIPFIPLKILLFVLTIGSAIALTRQSHSNRGHRIYKTVFFAFKRKNITYKSID